MKVARQTNPELGVKFVRRAENSGKRLTSAEAAIVKGMLLRGDRQHDIAAWFGVNGGRIGEISKGKKFLEIEPQTKGLPRPGPYLSGQASETLVSEFKKLRSKVRKLEQSDSIDRDSRTIVKSILDQLNAVIED